MSLTTFWIVAACVLYVLELVTTSFILLGLGLAATISFIAALLGLNIEIQIGVFIVVSLLFFLYVRPFLMKRWREREARLPKTNAEALVGRIGKVVEPINEAEKTGRVVIDGDNFRAVTKDGSLVPEGTHVEVVALDSTILVVLPKN